MRKEGNFSAFIGTGTTTLSTRLSSLFFLAQSAASMRKEITKAKTTYCYSLCRLKQSVENGERYGVGSGWGALVKYYERESA